MNIFDSFINPSPMKKADPLALSHFRRRVYIFLYVGDPHKAFDAEEEFQK